MSTEPDGFREFVEARSLGLLRTAWMLTGDSATAEDLLQTALARTWPHWSRISRDGNPNAYVRKVMVRLNATWRTRRWSGELPSADIGVSRELDPSAPRNELGQVDDRLLLLDALSALPVRQRQVVVLRFFDDLPVAEVAEIMGSSTGTVKSQTAKALEKLRGSLGAEALIRQEES